MGREYCYMSSPPTRYQVASGVATITLDAPERRNALGSALMRSLMGHFQQALDDPAVRVIVLTNAGSTFSAGADLKEGRDPSLEPGRLLFHDVLDAVDRSPKPVIGRIAGHAAGGAAALVALCDISVAVDTARIGITEARLGLPPSDVAAISPTGSRTVPSSRCS
jgi:enoyl-CoA hydratase/carnithine racemase